MHRRSLIALALGTIATTCIPAIASAQAQSWPQR